MLVQSALGNAVPCPGLHSLCSSTASVEVMRTEGMYTDKSLVSKLHASCDSHVSGAYSKPF